MWIYKKFWIWLYRYNLFAIFFLCWSVEWQDWRIVAPKAKSCSKLNKIYGFDFQVGFRGIFKQKRTEAAHSVSVRFLLCRSSYFLCCSIQRRATNFVLNYIELTLFMLDERCVSFNMVVTQMLHNDCKKISIVEHNIYCYCVTNTLQLPSFSPRSTYFFCMSWSSSFWIAAMLIPVISFISDKVSVGSVRIAFRIFV